MNEATRDNLEQALIEESVEGKVREDTLRQMADDIDATQELAERRTDVLLKGMQKHRKELDALAERIAALEDAMYSPCRGYGDAMDEEAAEGLVVEERDDAWDRLAEAENALEECRAGLKQVTKERDEALLDAGMLRIRLQPTL